MIKPALFLCLMATQTLSWAQVEETTFLPENNKKIFVTEKFNGGLTLQQFNRVIDKVHFYYAPTVRRYGGRLVMQKKWENPRVNAGTYRDKLSNKWFVNLYGGFARHPALSEDGFALVVCHEVGHHIGGAPKKISPDWSSTEGQSDYFATLKCLRKIWAFDYHERIIASMVIPKVVRSKCEKSFRRSWQRALCMRTAVAGLGVANVMSDTLKLPFASFEQEDTTIAPSTLEKHPTPQCRLDTYLRGAVCNVSPYRSLSQYNSARGTCSISLGHLEGTRPHCWYKPF